MSAPSAAAFPSSPPVALTLTLPLPPGVNNQYLTVGRRRVLSKPAQTFNRDVAKAVDLARRDGAVPPAAEAALRVSLLGVYLTFFFETPMRRDLDGGLKIALDALGRALGVDDRAVVDLHLTKRIDPLHPRLEVELETIADWEFDRPYVYLGEPSADPDAEPKPKPHLALGHPGLGPADPDHDLGHPDPGHPDPDPDPVVDPADRPPVP